ncbi:MAG: hypothetical protein WBE54_09740, partial [Bradyrhizobium sp.]
VMWRVNTNRAFPEFFAEVCQRPKMVSSNRHFVSSPAWDETKAVHTLKTRRTRKGFNGRPKI